MNQKIVIIAGPNGAGKTTFAKEFLPREADCPDFINADNNGRQSMKTKSRGSKDPDILASGKALRRAARRALEIGLQTGTSVFVLRDGKIVDLTKQKPARSMEKDGKRR